MPWEDGVIHIKDKSVDLLLTDLPYGMDFVSNRRKEKHMAIQNDNNLDWLPGWLIEMKRVCKEEAHLYIFCSWHNVDIFKQEVSKYFNVKNILIWEKNNTGMGDLEGDYAPKYEMILFCSNGVKKLNNGRDPNIIKARRTQNEYHPTQKPVSILKFLVSKSTKPGDIVLDTFAGSFSTARACKELGRNWICFEIEKVYCDIAIQLLNGSQEELFLE